MYDTTETQFGRNSVEANLSVDIMNEALNLCLCAICCTKTFHSCGRLCCNCWAVSTRKVEGKQLGSFIEEHPEKEDEYLNKFIDIELAIHAHKAPLLTLIKKTDSTE